MVRTRFAPSPTGFLHIGGLRTALFSYLFARHNGGIFILRIEDTDRTRYIEEAMTDIMESLKWVGIEWDEGPDIGGPYAPYKQSERKDIYLQHAEELIKRGNAYKCFCSQERLEKLREEQRKRGEKIGYDRHCRNLSEEDIKRYESENKPYVIRLKAPLSGETNFNDLIRGKITVSNETLDDIVLIKSDGFPTYHLANIVDDHLMRITHVIRGEEWISSTPKHVILYQSFGWEPPFFAHVPVILAPGGGKLSKRHGATTVKEFREKGYLSEAVLNFIALLGWSYDDKTEIFSMEDLIKYFTIEKINKASAVFSYDKLDWYNGVYIRKKSPEELLELGKPFIIKADLLTEDEIEANRDYLLKIIPLIQERIKLLSEIPEKIWFFFDRHFEIREKKELVPKGLDISQALDLLKKARKGLEKIETFTKDNIEEFIRGLMEETGFKTKQIFMPLRVAVTGTRVSPGLFETMEVLGKKRVLDRISKAIYYLEDRKSLE